MIMCLAFLTGLKREIHHPWEKNFGVHQINEKGQCKHWHFEKGKGRSK